MTQPGEDLHELDVPRFDADDRNVEAPDADAYEQAMPADPAAVPGVSRLSPDANEADAYEQTLVVGGRDDDYDR